MSILQQTIREAPKGHIFSREYLLEIAEAEKQCRFGQALTELVAALAACPRVEWLRNTGQSNRYHAMHEDALAAFLEKWRGLFE